jgi:hypothetical protein
MAEYGHPVCRLGDMPLNSSHLAPSGAEREWFFASFSSERGDGV